MLTHPFSALHLAADHGRWRCEALVGEQWYKGFGATPVAACADCDTAIAAKRPFGERAPTRLFRGKLPSTLVHADILIDFNL